VIRDLYLYKTLNSDCTLGSDLCPQNAFLAYRVWCQLLEQHLRYFVLSRQEDGAGLKALLLHSILISASQEALFDLEKKAKRLWRAIVQGLEKAHSTT
jgi:hypothetical protein